jgi:hypothetical protein
MSLQEVKNWPENGKSTSGMVIVKKTARAPVSAASEPDRKCGQTL